MALNEELDQVNVHSEDTFKVSSEFSGNVYSDKIVTTEAVQRFNATSLKLKYLTIKEYIGSNYSYIGLYNAVRATFVANAYTLSPFGALTLYDVDLYNLGCAWHTGAAHYGIIGTY